MSTPDVNVSLDVLPSTFVTFPGIHMHPLLVQTVNTGTNTVTLFGKLPYDVASEDVLRRNVIYPLHEMFLVRAGMAYVTGNSRFVFADDVIRTGAVPVPPAAPGAGQAWYRVEGIKAVRFDYSDNRVLTVRVLAEGDTSDSVRRGTAQRADLEGRWTGITFNPAMYYEEFSMSWRTRNVEAS
jgi:hypothetical protein